MKKNVVFALLMLLTLLVIVLNDAVDMNLLKTICIYPIRPFQNTVSFISDVISARKFSNEIMTTFADQSLIYRANQNYLQENLELRRMLGLLSQGKFEMMTAEVTGGDFSAYTELIINKGSIDGIDIQMPVMFLNGIVGKVIDVKEHYSKIQTIMDINFKIGVTDGKRSNFLISEYYKNGLLITYDISQSMSLMIGDTLFSSGIGGVFPAGVPVGTVKQSGSRRDGETFFVLLPCENLNSVRFVFIIMKRLDFPVKEYMILDNVEKIGEIGWYDILRRKK